MGGTQVQRISPSEFAETVFTLEGKPFSLKGRDYLKEVYNRDITEGILMTGRQVEKSTTNSVSMGTKTLTEPYFKGLYVAPLNDQVREFSSMRIGRLYSNSVDDVVNKYYRSKHDKDNVSMKEFNGVRGNGAVNYFRHCYDNGDNIRGLTVNSVYIDEVQDILSDAIPVIKECQSHALEAGSGTRTTWYTGTPKTFSNTIQKKWEDSTQNEWVIKCPHCKKHQIMGVQNMTPTKYICRVCKSDLPDEARANGFWYPLAPQKEIHGFRISQLMVPWITAKEIYSKYRTYTKDRFYNEVLGRSYENSDKPFTIIMLNAICQNEYYLLNRKHDYIASCPCFMGVDWGTGEKSYTVVKIYALLPTGQLVLVHHKRFLIGDELEMDNQILYISTMMQQFQVELCIADWGFGFTQHQTLRRSFGERMASCYYSSSQKKDKNYDAEQGRWVVNRTVTIQKYISDISKLNILWPGRNKDELDYLFDHHLAENAEYRKSYSGRSEELFYNHAEGSPDDGMHAGVYARLAKEIWLERGPANQMPEFSGVYM